MKRDMELIRKWLMKISGEYEFPKNEYPEDVLVTHLAMLVDAGFVDGECIWGQEDPGVAVFAAGNRLTWQGCDFLDASRDPSVWKVTTDRLKDIGGAVSFEVLKALLNDVAMRALGITTLPARVAPA